jgi:hypothetical protein
VVEFKYDSVGRRHEILRRIIKYTIDDRKTDKKFLRKNLRKYAAGLPFNRPGTPKKLTPEMKAEDLNIYRAGYVLKKKNNERFAVEWCMAEFEKIGRPKQYTTIKKCLRPST